MPPVTMPSLTLFSLISWFTSLYPACVVFGWFIGILVSLAELLDKYVPNESIVATAIGIASALIDNVPLGKQII